MIVVEGLSHQRFEPVRHSVIPSVRPSVHPCASRSHGVLCAAPWGTPAAAVPMAEVPGATACWLGACKANQKAAEGGEGSRGGAAPRGGCAAPEMVLAKACRGETIYYIFISLYICVSTTVYIYIYI